MRDDEETLRTLGQQIEVVWYPAGHLGAATDTTIQHFATMRASLSASWAAGTPGVLPRAQLTFIVPASPTGLEREYSE